MLVKGDRRVLISTVSQSSAQPPFSTSGVRDTKSSWESLWWKEMWPQRQFDTQQKDESASHTQHELHWGKTAERGSTASSSSSCSSVGHASRPRASSTHTASQRDWLREAPPKVPPPVPSVLTLLPHTPVNVSGSLTGSPASLSTSCCRCFMERSSDSSSNTALIPNFMTQRTHPRRTFSVPRFSFLSLRPNLVYLMFEHLSLIKSDSSAALKYFIFKAFYKGEYKSATSPI